MAFLKSPEFVAEVPPSRARNGRPSMFRKIAEALKSNPGQWAIVETAKKGKTPMFRNRVHQEKLTDQFEVRQRWDGNGHVNVYARYVGQATAPAESGNKE